MDIFRIILVEVTEHYNLWIICSNESNIIHPRCVWQNGRAEELNTTYLEHCRQFFDALFHLILSFLLSYLTAVAWVSEPDLAPQKMKLSQKFRHLMRCKKYLKKFFLSRLVSEIQLFVYIFGWISKWPPEVRKGWLVKFFEVSYYQKNFQPPTLPNSEDR